MLETTLAFMTMMTLMLGIVEFSMMAYTYSAVAEATHVGVRYAVMHGTYSTNCSGPTSGCGDPSAGNVAAQVTQYAATFAANAQGLKVDVSYPDSSSTSPSRVVVAVSYTYQPLFLFPGLNQAFNVSSQGRIVY